MTLRQFMLKNNKDSDGWNEQRACANQNWGGGRADCWSRFTSSEVVRKHAKKDEG